MEMEMREGVRVWKAAVLSGVVFGTLFGIVFGCVHVLLLSRAGGDIRTVLVTSLAAASVVAIAVFFDSSRSEASNARRAFVTVPARRNH